MINQKTIEKETSSLLKETSLLSAPIDLHELAKHLGLTIIESDPEDNELSGALIRDETPKALINSTHHENRKRFTLAHEIGHFMLHHGEDSFVDSSDKKQIKVLFRLNHPQNSNIEKEANFFAASLLMPLELLQKEIDQFEGEKDDLISKLSNKFKVSNEAMGYRLLNLGYINAT
jgi:Zn-dependent peptidase ImmA (M78 family)